MVERVMKLPEVTRGLRHLNQVRLMVHELVLPQLVADLPEELLAIAHILRPFNPLGRGAIDHA
jgi:hypothetical protein